jgi:hypothetical protein
VRKRGIDQAIFQKSFGTDRYDEPWIRLIQVTEFFTAATHLFFRRP